VNTLLTIAFVVIVVWAVVVVATALQGG